MLLHNIRNQLYNNSASHLKKQNPHVQFNNIQQNSRKPAHKFTHDNGKAHNLSHSGHVYSFMQSNRAQKILTLKMQNVTRK